MKCPKCEYLGFETGDRCRNCGYDFSLMSGDEPLPDLDLRAPEPAPAPGQSDAWLADIDRDLGVFDAPLGDGAPAPAVPALDAMALDEATTVAPQPAGAIALPDPPANPAAMPGPAVMPIAAAPPSPARFTPSSLPLFTGPGDDDAPLVKLPAAPRAPLSVRRTPENPRLRSVPKIVPKAPEPVLQFEEPVTPVPAPVPPPGRAAGAGTPWARLTAAVIDHVILGAVDVSVLYFTLKVAAVPGASWQQIPILPMAAFLLLLKVMYFSAFTAVGGQTIGKMGARIRVIADDGGRIDSACALRRSLAGLLSLATLGAAFLPAILGEDHRAIHDRVARTRVVTA